MSYQKAMARIKALEAYEAQFEHSEFNINPINKIQRAKIRAARKLNRHNHCFIYSVNEGMEEETTPIVQEYYKGMVYNFTGCFVMGYYNSETVKLIGKWRSMSHPWNQTEGLRVLNRIFNTPGLISLNWV